MTTTLTSTVALDEEGERLDTYLASLDEVPQSRSQIKRSIARGDVLLNGAQPSKSGVRLRAGDRVTYRPPAPATRATSTPPPPALNPPPPEFSNARRRGREGRGS